MHLIQSWFILLSQLSLFTSTVYAQRLVTAGEVPPASQTYDFDSESRCRLLAHQSVVLEVNGRRLLILDGGFGSWITELNGEQVRVLDLNGYTVAFDLTNDCSTTSIEPFWQIKKPNGTLGPPVTNHGQLWFSDDMKTIWYHDGHYYDEPSWNTSLYHIEKWQIPQWQLWQMNITEATNGWKDVTESVKGHELIDRTFAGAAVSVPAAKKSFGIGGLVDPTTSADTPNGTAQTTDQFVIYDHVSNTLTRQKYYSPLSTNGTFQGDLVHLPIGSGSGYVMSLMSLQNPTTSKWVYTDDAAENPDNVEPVKLDSIPLYDIDAGTWFEQDTSWFMNQIPQPRTRFCSALFYNGADNTYDLWVHGGQLVSNEDIGVPDIYVLSMPAFTWTKIQTSLPNTNLIRSHTCHAIGGQFVIVGGYPPGLKVPTNASCDAEYIKVLSIEDDGLSWKSSFTTDSKYRTPQSIRDIVNNRQIPWSGFANQKLKDDFAWKPSNGARLVGIIGGVIGGLLILALAGVGLWYFLRRRRTTAQRRLSDTPSSPRPEPLARAGTNKSMPEANRPLTSSVTELRLPGQVHDVERTSSHDVADRREKGESLFGRSLFKSG